MSKLLDTATEVASNYKNTAVAGSTILFSVASLTNYVQPVLACIGLLAGIVLSIISVRKNLAEIKESNLRSKKFEIELQKLIEHEETQKKGNQSESQKENNANT